MLKTTIITGATNGIGKIIANKLLNKNHKVINLSKSGIIPDLFKNMNFESHKCDISDIKNTFEVVTNITQKNKIDNVILFFTSSLELFYHTRCKFLRTFLRSLPCGA